MFVRRNVRPRDTGAPNMTPARASRQDASPPGTVRPAEIPGRGVDSAQQIGVDVWKTDVLEFLRRF